MKDLKKKRRKTDRARYRRRFVSIVLAFALVINCLPLEWVADYLGVSDYISITEPLKAYAYSPTKGADAFAGTAHTFQNTADFVDYCYHYNHTDGFAALHKGDSISIAINSGTTELSADFEGLGNLSAPFEGRVTFGSTGNYAMSGYRAFFGYVSDKATVSGLAYTRLADVGANESNPLFAEHVVNGGGTGTWSVEALGSCTFSGVIGEIGEGSHVNLTYTNSTGKDMVFNASEGLTDAGAVCGKMGANSGLTLSYTGAIDFGVTSANGNAGGLVGTMGSGANITISTAPTSFSPAVTANGYAGGLVGDMAASATITGRPATVAGTVKGETAAGGLYGHYGYASAASVNLTDAAYQTTAKVSGGYCGGLFGELETSGGLTITSYDSDSSSVVEKSYSTTSDGNTCFGGVIGKLTTTSLTDTVLLQNLKVKPSAGATFNTYGGVIGLVDSASYVQVDNVTVTAQNPGKTSSFGGVIGATSANSGVFVDLGDFKLTATSFKGGGVVGTFNNGVLRLSGTTDMGAGSPASGDGYGQLIGINNNVLVYALGSGSYASATAFTSGWAFKRSGSDTADDLGTWGEVIRTFSGSNAVTAGIIDETNLSSGHYVTLAGAETTIDTQVKFAKTALNIQLNKGSDYDCLKFTSGDTNNRSTLLGSGSTLTIGADITLGGTGITGLMRDGGDVSTLGSFAGTIDGLKGTDETYKITLATGEIYGFDSTGAALTSSATGAGQIYRHQHTGLLSVLSGTVSNLTVDGSITVRNCVDGMNIGGIASCNGGNITLTKVIANEKISYHEETIIDGSETSGKNIGGLIGFVGTDGTININGECVVGEGNSSKPDIKLSGSHESWNVYGGAIGKVTAEGFTVNVGTDGSSTNGLTVKTYVDVSGITAVEGNSNSGGLIGHITNAGRYKSRKVNIYKLDYNGCSIGNAANTNGGGLLGYSWLNTTANIKGLTVTSATINNCTTSGTAGGNENIGAMCYVATGKWVVDSLAVSSLSMPSGGGTSFGMLVNKAYTYGTNSYTGGLYLDILNSGYTITAATLTGVTGKYDEIAAYTAKDAAGILTGGAGVVSINMNTPRAGAVVNDVSVPNVRIADYTVEEPTTTGTGTYVNKLTGRTSTVNPTARYYYNLDLMSSSDNAQNIMLWSVNKYAHTDIADEFDTSLTNTLSGTADMTGLSFYPVALANGITVGNLTLTLDYAGIYAKTGATMDPAVSNQHFLMHSGLFLNSSAGSTLTINGTLSLNGNFLEVGKYKGVLISDTMKGALTCTSGSIVLNGITPKSTGSINYTDGYLLVNNISRADSTVAIPELKLYNVSMGTGYTAGTTVAKSLIGPAVGPGLKMTFSKIKLDGATSSSIFKQSTLVNSIKTNQDAQLVYNFYFDDDWGDSDEDDNADHNVTYGYELTYSTEYSGQEKKYSSSTGSEKKRYYVHPTTEPNSSTSEFDFGSYRPYVYQVYTNNTPDENGYYFREIMVNVEAEGLTNGCGTYNDPYLISTAAQLKSVAAFLQNNTYATTLGNVTLPKTKPSSFTSGDHWCENNHGEYTASDTSFTAPSGGETWSRDDVQKYLANAYYKITASNIVLDDGFAGLGGKTANTAFRGVIVGSGTNNGEPTVTITNQSDNPFIKVSNGCVVKDINIVVAKESIDISQTKRAYNDAYFGYDYSNGNVCKFYGGIIGEIMGGDNIIDNSYVSYSYTDSENNAHTTSITLTGTDGYGTIVPVGGYVGVVVFGGLIFKNMTVTDTVTTVENEGTEEETTTTSQVLRANNSHLTVKYTGKTYNLADNSGQEAWAAIYVNPIVGRVINGYAINETTQFSVTENNKYHDDDKTTRAGALHTLKNGTKHYSIADINKNEKNKLEVTSVPSDTNTDGVINMPNSQALFVLSLITQSCAGTAQSATGDYKTSLSYGTYSTKEYGESSNTNHVYGMSHIANYSNVGSATSTNDSDYLLAKKDTAGNTATTDYAIPYVIYHYTKDTNGDFNARCVTSTLGYYDIKLTGKTANGTRTPSEVEGEPDTVTPLDSYTYQLPDSFRGLGSVGNYDIYYPNTPSGNNEGNNISDLWVDRGSNQYCIKLDVFTGNGCIIDEDIYLNKYQYDNYWNVMHKGTNQNLSTNAQGFEPNTRKNNHGIALFDSLIMKSTSSKLCDFSLTGSINTQIYNNSYKSSKNDQIKTGIANEYIWLSVGGVVGWATNGTCLYFEKIHLNNICISGSSHIGGLLGFSGLSSTTLSVTVSECDASNISVKMTSAKTNETFEKSRNAIGTLIGKVYEATVYIYGTASKESNTDLSKYSEVKISSFGFANDSNSVVYTASAGGLVGFTGNGCRAYDMKVMPFGTSDITIGGNISSVGYVGGVVGCMQPCVEKASSCLAAFKNCTIEGVNISGAYAGGLYGGKWSGNWVPYKIEIENCKLLGNSQRNSITGATHAGGLIGYGIVYSNASPNISISDSCVSNYIIKANAGKYAGGFVGYSKCQTGSITCYIHDSSIENCIIGQGGKDKDYVGGIIGGIEKHTKNKILGYNIKLDDVSSPNTNRKGTWIGSVSTDTNNKTSIQFSGMAVYGDSYNFTQNVGNGSADSSFVFADYTGQSYGDATTARMTVSGTDVFTLDSTNKTILRTVSQDVMNGEKTENRMQVYKYSYSTVPEGTETESADGWSISGSTITHIADGKQYVYNVSLTDNEIFSLNATDKIITRQSISGDTTRTINYNYTVVPTGTSTTDADQWLMDETNGTITRVVGGLKYIYTVAVSGLNKGTVVTMPKYPFVNVNPQSKLGASEVLSSDGAVLYGSNVADVTSGGETVVSYKYPDNNVTKYYPSSTTMAAKIYADYKAGTSSRRYTTFSDDTISSVTVGNTTTDYKILDYMNRTVEDDGDRISTFATERQGVQLQAGVEDFAVIVIATADDDETTNLINRYIQLVTNTSGTNYAATDSNGYYVVDIKTCTYSEGSFSINPAQTQSTTGIKIEDNKFKLNRNYADSKKTNTFTLIDIQFKDPMNPKTSTSSGLTAYHLYVPVYTVKEMAVNFYAVAKTGSHSVPYPGTNEYASLMNADCTHADSLDTWMTHYFRYEYEADDLNTLLNSGKLKWNYEKSLDFQTYTAADEDERLTKGSYMVLVDPNGNADQAYYAKAGDMTSYSYTDTQNNRTRTCWTVPFSAFKKDNATEDPMEIGTFNKVIAKSIVATPNANNQGNYNLLSLTDTQIANGDYDVYVITTSEGVSTTTYYEFCVNGDGDTNLAVPDNTTVYEDYYLSIYVPKPSEYTNQLYHYTVISPTRLSSENIDYTTADKPSVKSAGLTQAHSCSILISDLFKQTVKVNNVSKMTVTPSNEIITANNRTITVDISSVVEPNNATGILYMNADEFYHSFYINLIRDGENGKDSDIKALSDSNITAKYSVDSEIDENSQNCADVDLEDMYLNVQTFPDTDSATMLSKLTSGNKQFTIYARIAMTFDEEELTLEFPERNSGESYGVYVQAASNLAYDPETLAYSSMTERYPQDNHKYYIESVPSATLRYSSKVDDLDTFDAIGANSKNRSTLGVNGISTNDAGRTNMPVNTEAYYNVQSISSASNATRVKLTFALSKKTDTGSPISSISYVPISDLRNYLEGTITFKSGTAQATSVNLSTAESPVDSITVWLDAANCKKENGIYDIEISFNAKSGDGFTEYANYRVDLTTELYDGNTDDDNIDNTVAQDYLIYTNAKINPEFLKEP